MTHLLNPYIDDDGETVVKALVKGEKREYCQLFKKMDGLEGLRVPGWWYSEKYDGEHAIWDGGVSRGLRGVPWCGDPTVVCTGLFSRYGSVIHAPDWWLDRLPRGVILEGELWTGYDDRSRLMSIVRRKDYGGEWSVVRYICFDAPPPVTWLEEKVSRGGVKHVATKWAVTGKRLEVARSVWDDCVVRVQDGMALWKDVEARGGEGVVGVRGNSWYENKRVDWCLKYKPFLDDEGVVVRVIPGDGRHSGRMGSVEVKWSGGSFVLGTGFTDAERDAGLAVGTMITFRYRALSADGVPLEARYWRVYGT
jgi:DNA ligase 1